MNELKSERKKKEIADIVKKKYNMENVMYKTDNI